MISIKRTFATLLLFAFCIVFTPQIANSIPLTTNEDSLHDFLQNTKEIKAVFDYPSMEKTTNIAGKTKLAAHTPIAIRCTETISTKDIVSGGVVKFAVVSDIMSSNGSVLVKAGTPVTAQISFAKSNGMLGRSGEITITDFHTTAVDGTYIPLSGSVSAKPDDKMTLSIVLSVLICPLFLLIKGNEAQVNVGTTKTAYTIADIYIKTVRI